MVDVFRQSLAAPAPGPTYTLEPGEPGTGIVVNGIPAILDNVHRNDVRVDLRAGLNHAFIVEHPIATATCIGLHDVVIKGTRRDWDFYRATDRESFARFLAPSAIVGPPNGAHCDVDFVFGSNVSRECGCNALSIRKESASLDLMTVDEPVALGQGKAFWIKLSPWTSDGGRKVLEIQVQVMGSPIASATLDPVRGIIGAGDNSIFKDILKARSPAVVGPCMEGAFHAIGDIVADLAGLGNVRVGKVKANLGPAYHSLTIGLVRKIVSNGMLVRA